MRFPELPESHLEGDAVLDHILFWTTAYPAAWATRRQVNGAHRRLTTAIIDIHGPPNESMNFGRTFRVH
jgi:hypothetical protein